MNINSIGQAAYNKAQINKRENPNANAKAFQDLTKAKSPRDYLQENPSTRAAKAQADSPVYGKAQSVLGEMNGLAKQAQDPNLTAEQRAALNQQFQDKKAELKSLGIGTNATNPDPNSGSLSELDLGLEGTDLTSPDNAVAAQTAGASAYGGLIQQQGYVQGEAYDYESRDNEAAAQRFFADQFQESQKDTSKDTVADPVTSQKIGAYLQQQETAQKRAGVLKILT